MSYSYLNMEYRAVLHYPCNHVTFGDCCFPKINLPSFRMKPSLSLEDSGKNTQKNCFVISLSS